MPLLSARLHSDHPPPIPQPTPVTTAILPLRVVPPPVTSLPVPVPPPPRVFTPLATPASATKSPHRNTPVRSTRDVLSKQNMPLADLHRTIPASPMLRQSTGVHHPAPAVLITVEPPTPIAHCTRSCLKVSPLAASSQTFPSKFFQGWASSEVLHGNQWSLLALAVLDPEIGQYL